jgi:hypothetical protein
VCDAGNVIGFDAGATGVTAIAKTCLNSNSIPMIHFVSNKKSLVA